MAQQLVKDKGNESIGYKSVMSLSLYLKYMLMVLVRYLRKLILLKTNLRKLKLYLIQLVNIRDATE